MAKKKPTEVQNDGRITREFFDNPDGTFAMDVKCSKCGEPITEVNEFGMFCKNLCGLEESKLAAKSFGELMNAFGAAIEKLQGIIDKK
jgi:hypothetical protein